jgi:hypothetical protein
MDCTLEKMSSHAHATFCMRASPTSKVSPSRAAAPSPMCWNLIAGRALKPIVIRGDGGTAMTETDWTAVGSALLLACWFGFLLLLLYFLTATMPP